VAQCRPVQAYNLRMRGAELVVVQTFGSRAEAEMARNRLEAEGIDAMVQADTAGGMREHLAWSGAGFRVLVREEDEAAAREILKP
jgi:hypothetical protein